MNFLYLNNIDPFLPRSPCDNLPDFDISDEANSPVLSYEEPLPSLFLKIDNQVKSIEAEGEKSIEESTEKKKTVRKKRKRLKDVYISAISPKAKKKKLGMSREKLDSVKVELFESDRPILTKSTSKIKTGPGIISINRFTENKIQISIFNGRNKIGSFYMSKRTNYYNFYCDIIECMFTSKSCVITWREKGITHKNFDWYFMDKLKKENISSTQIYIIYL